MAVLVRSKCKKPRHELMPEYEEAYQRALQKMAIEAAMAAYLHPYQYVNGRPLWFYFLPLEVRPLFKNIKKEKSR